jgi:hypothetical protein
MTQPKNVFDWKDGTPSIWSRDKELKRLLVGRIWGQAGRAKMQLESKQQITIYSKAKIGK